MERKVRERVGCKKWVGRRKTGLTGLFIRSAGPCIQMSCLRFEQPEL